MKKMKKRYRYVFYGILGLIFLYFNLVIVNTFLPTRKVPRNDFFKTSDFLNIAHRGGAGIAPENTLWAFSNALVVGADVLELDFHRSKDNVLVAIHDKSVDRTTEGTGLVKDLTLQEIKELNAGYRFQKNGEFPFRSLGIKIPTLEEVFSAFPEERMVIEIKPIDEENFASTRLICMLLEKYDRLDRTLIASFSDEVIAHLIENCPNVLTVSALGDSFKFLILNKLNLINLYKPLHLAFEIPPSAFDGKLKVYSPSFLEEAAKRNISLHLWTINDEEEMKRFLQEGVHGILTDYPDKLTKIIESRQESKEKP